MTLPTYMFRGIKCSKNNFCQFFQTIWNFVIFNPFVRIRNFTIALYFRLKLDWDAKKIKEKVQKNFQFFVIYQESL